jgi:hypothetical protein
MVRTARCASFRPSTSVNVSAIGPGSACAAGRKRRALPIRRARAPARNGRSGTTNASCQESIGGSACGAAAAATACSTTPIQAGRDVPAPGTAARSCRASARSGQPGSSRPAARPGSAEIAGSSTAGSWHEPRPGAWVKTTQFPVLRGSSWLRLSAAAQPDGPWPGSERPCRPAGGSRELAKMGALHACGQAPQRTGLEQT